MKKKRVDVVVPTYNEKDNIEALCLTLLSIFNDTLQAYNCMVLIIDNGSKDGTRAIIRRLCQEHPQVKAILNTRNFGPDRSPVYAYTCSDADCVVHMAADFQDPPELLPQFLQKWEEGYKIVIGKKTKAEEGWLKTKIRGFYYRLLDRIADYEHISQFTGFGLYDRKVLDAIRIINDPNPYMRGLVAEIGFRRAEISFQQPKRARGKSSTSFYSLYEVAMLGITSSSKMLMRMATFVGFGIGIISFLIGLVYLILKLVHWNSFMMGQAPLVVGVFFIGAVQLFFIGLMGEYILSINTRIMNRPLVIEEERLNFDNAKMLFGLTET